MALSGYRNTIFKLRYAISKDEEFEQACKRVGEFIANAENGEDRAHWAGRFTKVLEEEKFSPGGRVWHGCGRPKPGLINCYVIPAGDSREGWGTLLHDVIVISGLGGGAGINFSNIRPREWPIRGTGGRATGAVSLMKIVNAAADQLRAGGGRRAALMFCLRYDHPDILEFINVKLDRKEINLANISIIIDDEFTAKLKGGETIIPKFNGLVRVICTNGDKEWGRTIPLDKIDEIAKLDPQDFLDDDGAVPTSIKIDQYKADWLWAKMVDNAWESAEPGILNFSFIENEHNMWYATPVSSTNPCVTGDTLVSVADGRHAVTIRQLAEEGKDIPVYARDKDGHPVIKTMRHPRITGYNQDIYEVLFDDGSKIKCTGNHKIRMKDGSYRETKDLTAGDSVDIYTKWATTFEEEFRHSNSKSQEYWMLNNGKKNVFEHRFIYEQLVGEIPAGSVIHHKDFNGKNNSIDNLEVMYKRDHDKFHDISGDKNPMRRFPHKNWRKDPVKQEEMRQKYHVGAKRSAETRRRISDKVLERCADPEYLKRLSESQKKARVEYADVYEESIKRRSERHLEECQKLTDLECFLQNNSVMVKKHCERCGKEFVTYFYMREQGYCSRRCAMIIASKIAGERKHRRYKQIHHDLQNKIFDLFSKHVVSEAEIPTWDHFSKMLNENGINDLRSAGLHYSYRKFVEGVCERFGVKPVSAQAINKNTGDCRRRLATQLVDNGLTYNHKIVSITKIGTDTVYNGTVDDVHNFDVVLQQTTTSYGRTKYIYINNLQCGEVCLPDYGSCDLGAVNLAKHVVDGKIDWDSLSDTITVGVRMLDNVLDMTHYPLQQIADLAQRQRRIGLGVMGLHHAMLLCGVKYDSEEGLQFVDTLFKFIKREAYEASVFLAVQKGEFPDLDRQKFLKSGFCKRLPASLKSKIKEYGIRNATLLTCAPTGTTSIVAGVSSGIEPIFAPAYIRRHIEGEETKETVVTDPLFQKFLDEGKDVSHFVGSHDISPEWHLKMQVAIQRHIDASISKTINFDGNRLGKEELGNMLLKNIDQIKGTTVYREGSRGEEPLQAIPVEEALKRIKEISESQVADNSCQSGKCQLT